MNRKDAVALNVIIYFTLWMLALQVWDSFKKRGELAAMLKGLRPRHLGWGLLVLFTTLVTLAATATFAFELAGWMRWSWLTALTSHEGSMLSAAADAGTTKSTVPKAVVYALYGFLLLALPMAALIEEKMFRRGAEHRSKLRNAAFALAFAMGHMVVGFPVFAALALFPLGLWLTLYYRIQWRRSGGDSQAAMLEAGRVHLMNNLLAIGLGYLLLNAVRGP